MAEQRLGLVIDARADDAIRDLRTVNRLVDDFDRETRQAGAASREMGGGVSSAAGEMRQMGVAVQAFMGLAITQFVLGLGRAFATLAIDIVRTAAEFQNLENALRSAAGSDAVFEQLRGVVRELRELPNVETETAVRGLARIMAAGQDAEQAAVTFRGLALATTAAGQGAAELDGAMVAVSQSLASGAIRAEELNQLADRGLSPVLRVLADDFGVTNATAQETDRVLKELNLTAEEFWVLVSKRLITANAEMADQFGNTLTNAVSNLNNAWLDLKLALAGDEFTGLIPILQGFSEVLKGLSLVIERNRERWMAWLQVVRAVSSFIPGLREITRGIGNLADLGRSASEGTDFTGGEGETAADAAMRERFREMLTQRRAVVKEAAKEEVDLAKIRQDAERELERAAREASRVREEMQRTQERARREALREQEKQAREMERAQREFLRLIEQAQQEELRRAQRAQDIRVESASLELRLLRVRQADAWEIFRVEQAIARERQRGALLAGDDPILSSQRAFVEIEEAFKRLQDERKRKADEEHRQRMEGIRKEFEERQRSAEKVADILQDAFRMPDIGSAILGLGGADPGQLSPFLGRGNQFAQATEHNMQVAFSRISQEMERRIFNALEGWMRSQRAAF